MPLELVFGPCSSSRHSGLLSIIGSTLILSCACAARLSHHAGAPGAGVWRLVLAPMALSLCHAGVCLCHAPVPLEQVFGPGSHGSVVARLNVEGQHRGAVAAARAQQVWVQMLFRRCGLGVEVARRCAGARVLWQLHALMRCEDARALWQLHALNRYECGMKSGCCMQGNSEKGDTWERWGWGAATYAQQAEFGIWCSFVWEGGVDVAAVCHALLVP
eukprot:1160527-Pelagomonas_calceolata.AAC.9